MTRQEISDLIQKGIKMLQKDKLWPEFEIPEILVTRPEDLSHGDYATNIAFQIAGLVKKSPMETAGLLTQALKSTVKSQTSKLFDNIEVASPGFVNFFLSKDYLQTQVVEILKKKDKFGQINIGKKERVNVEFVSANPTGPLHIGNARGGFCGDVLANVLEVAGYKVTREYYVNDMGRQIEVLKNSLEGKEPSYKNPYIDELKNKGIKKTGEAVKFIIKKIKETTDRMGIRYDKWFYESDLYKNKEIDKVLKFLKQKKLIYTEQGALWFNSKKFGDDKDRVLIKADGEKTYFLSELAYLKNKFERGFDNLIIFLGAEHHGYIGRLKAGADALGYNAERVNPIIYQLVHLMEQGREVRMSKRTGIYVTIDELLDEIGLDVARFFFLTRGYGNHLNFDLDLAKEQSEKNPVYYVQYAYARISSILRKAQNNFNFQFSFAAHRRQGAKRPVCIFNFQSRPKFQLLNHGSELALIKQLIRLPEVVEDTTKDYQVQRLPQYAVDLATVFHQFYRDCRVISENKVLTQARLGLIMATKTVFKDVLTLMGISAPERM